MTNPFTTIGPKQGGAPWVNPYAQSSGGKVTDASGNYAPSATAMAKHGETNPFLLGQIAEPKSGVNLWNGMPGLKGTPTAAAPISMPMGLQIGSPEALAMEEKVRVQNADWASRKPAPRQYDPAAAFNQQQNQQPTILPNLNTSGANPYLSDPLMASHYGQQNPLYMNQDQQNDFYGDLYL